MKYKILRISFSLLILFFSFNANAQWLHNLNFINHDKDSVAAVRFDFDYEVSSDAITNQFINTYINAKFINVDLKDKVSDKLKATNHIGSSLNTGISYRSKASHNKCNSQQVLFQWTAGFRHRVLFNASFSKDLFRLYFYGNKVYENQTANINDFHYSFSEFQQLQLGSIITIIRPHATWTSMVNLSYLNGQDYLSIETTRGKLFTATDAEYVDLDLALTAREADSASRKFGATNGAGVSLDCGFRLDKKKWKLSLQLNDLGFISWNKRSSKAEVDTNYHFEGVEVQNILDSVYFEIKSDQDFKNGFFKTRSYEKFTQHLPTQILFSIETAAIHPNIHAYATLRYRFNADMNLPNFLAGADYLFTKSFYAGINLQYGGYSKLHVGIRAAMDAGKGFTLYAGSSYLDGWLLKNNAGGVGASAGIQKLF